jgi:penicillin-binding protein 2
VKKPKDPRQRRAVLMTGIILVVFTGLIAQLGNLTLLQEQQFRSVAEMQRTRSLPVFAPRGIIYDRNMEPLITNRPANSVFVQYPYYKQQEVLQRLSVILSIPLSDIQKQVRDKMESGEYYDPVRLKDDITPEQYATILERKPDLPGVEVQAQPIRVYPYKDVAAHVLGYVNEIGRDELDKLKSKGYLPGEIIGRTGLEAFYEDVLRGKPGIREVEINYLNQPLGEVQSVDPQPGNSVVLTLDANLQQVAERALDWDMWRIRNTIIGDGPWPNAKAGAVVVMNVKTGAILAMASRPAFDPNMFARGITQKELDALQDPVLTPEVNRAIQTAYQPGSTWKMMTSTSALENGVIGPYDKVYCSGVYDKLHHPKDWTPYGHGWVDTVGALEGSCDIYYYEMGYRLGIDRLVGTAQEFGFGAPTGIDLGGENPGMLPDARHREEIWAKERKDPWGDGHTLSAAIGQIVNVTPLQLVRYVSTLGNHGKIMKPFLVQKVVDSQGRTVKEFSPQQVGAVNIQPEYLEAILKGMQAVNGPGGGSDYNIYPLPGIKTAGKTGTAEYPPMNDYGFFVSLSPANDPQIAVAVAIEQAGHGGSVSAVARAIEAAFYGVKLPDYDPAHVPDEFPNDLAGLRRKYRVVGSGQ